MALNNLQLKFKQKLVVRDSDEYFGFRVMYDGKLQRYVITDVKDGSKVSRWGLKNGVFLASIYKTTYTGKKVRLFVSDVKCPGDVDNFLSNARHARVFYNQIKEKKSLFSRLVGDINPKKSSTDGSSSDDDAWNCCDQSKQKKEIPNMTSSCKSDFPDFSVESDFSSFKFVVERKELFVNPHMISALSPVFASMATKDGFKEKTRQMVTVGEEKYEDFLELLQCCLPAIGPGATKPISVSNFAVMSRLADKFQIDSLKETCVDYIQNQFQHEDASLKQILQALDSATTFELDKESLISLISRAATFDYTMLKESDVFDWLKPKLLVALFSANKDYQNYRKECLQANKEIAELMPTAERLVDRTLFD